MERPPFANISEVPPILQSVFHVDLPNDDYQIVYGLDESNIEKICSDKPYSRSEEPWAVRYAPYRFKTLETYPYLTPFKPIPAEVANRLHITIAMMGNRNLIPNAVRLRYRDFFPIGEISCPGKSASIDFTGIADAQSAEERKEAVELYFNIVAQKESSRSDAIHITTVDYLNHFGFQTFHAPIRNYPLHVRICDINIMNKHIKGEFITEDDKNKSAERLSNLWESCY